MKILKNNFIKKIGLSNPSNLKQNYFSFFESKETIKLSDNLPDIKKTVSVIVEHEIISKKTINTLQGYSSEGNYFTGKKIIIYLKLKQKILYTSEDETIHLIVNEFFDSVSIVIPTTIKGSSPQKLIDCGYIETGVYIQDIILRKINKRSIFCNIYVFVDICPLPNYEIAYSINNNDISNLLICYDFGENKKQIASFETSKYIKPKWSPNGNKIAFLINKEKQETYMLNVYNLDANKLEELNNIKIFTSITSFCWSQDGSSIIFSGIKNKSKELFSIDLSTLDIKQLTLGKNNRKSYKPSISPENKSIAFIQSIYNTSNLCLMDMNGMHIKRLSSSNSIKCFDWSNDSKSIAYVSNIRDKKDCLNIVDIISLKTRKINLQDEIIRIRKVKYSPNNKYLTFIGCSSNTENIYIYIFNDNSCINLTNNFKDVHISDLDWEIDSLFIYYSSDDYHYYNIYCISLETLKILNITNSTSSNIFLNYRPKIV